MVDEYLSEREQADQLRRWLSENWIWLVAGVALTLAGYYGYRWWESRQATRAVAAGERFAAMLEAIGAGRAEDGVQIAGELTGEYADTPYAEQATLVLARMDVDGGDFAAAEAKLARVADGSKDPDLRICSQLGGGSFKAQMKRADKSGAAVAVILGDAEAERGEAAVKHLRSEARQEACAWDGVPGKIRALLARDS